MNALDFDCPTCTAPIGSPCVSAGVTHGKRRRLANPAEQGEILDHYEEAFALDEQYLDQLTSLASKAPFAIRAHINAAIPVLRAAAKAYASEGSVAGHLCTAVSRWRQERK